MRLLDSFEEFLAKYFAKSETYFSNSLVNLHRTNPPTQTFAGGRH